MLLDNFYSKPDSLQEFIQSHFTQQQINQLKGKVKVDQIEEIKNNQEQAISIIKNEISS
jgi:hypothetical protein